MGIGAIQRPTSGWLRSSRPMTNSAIAVAAMPCSATSSSFGLAGIEDGDDRLSHAGMRRRASRSLGEPRPADRRWPAGTRRARASRPCGLVDTQPGSGRPGRGPLHPSVSSAFGATPPGGRRFATRRPSSRRARLCLLVAASSARSAAFSAMTFCAPSARPAAATPGTPGRRPRSTSSRYRSTRRPRALRR